MIFRCLIVPTSNRSVGYVSKRSKLLALKSIQCLRVEQLSKYVHELEVNDTLITRTEILLRGAYIDYYKGGGGVIT